MGERRPIRTRNTTFAKQTAQYLIKLGLKPNQISLLSMVFAALAGICLGLSSHNPAKLLHISILLAAAFFILLRLLCNLFDGMLAIEGGFASKAGEIYNDLPDRPSDIFILIGAGYAAATIPGAEILGWLTALLAVMTAYVRLLGKVSGTEHFFIGPMAKQHRMAVMITACLLAAICGEVAANWIFVIALTCIAAGSIITIIRRLKFIFRALEAS